MKRNLAYYIIAMLLLASATGLYAQKTIRINTDESKINWTGKKPTGEHHGYVKLKEGQLLLENNEVTGGSFTIDMNSVTNTDLSNDASRNRLVNHLKSPDFFDVQKYPVAKFVIKDVNKINNGAKKERKATHTLTGDLTIKGITKEVTFDVSINSLNGKLTSSTPKFDINRTDWGVNHQSKSVFANLRDDFINDEIELSVDLVSD